MAIDNEEMLEAANIPSGSQDSRLPEGMARAGMSYSGMEYSGMDYTPMADTPPGSPSTAKKIASNPVARVLSKTVKLGIVLGVVLIIWKLASSKGRD